MKRIVILILKCSIGISLFLTIGVVIYMGNIHVPDGVIREAVRRSDLTDRNYILCRRERTTGFDWIMIRDEHGRRVNELINIAGPVPWDIGLYHGFVMANNTYVFYVEEVRKVHSEAINEYSFEYVVSDWDILYPIRRESLPLEMFCQSWRFITEDDLHE